MAKVITFSNQKGGVAKTTSAVMTVGNLVNRGYKVLLIDTDPQANATDYIAARCGETKNLYSLLTGEYTINEVIIHTKEFGDIIPASPRLYNDEVLSKNPYGLKKIISAVRNLYDYIIIDTPPNLGKIQIIGILASEYVVIPTMATRESVKGMEMLIDTVKQYREYNPMIKIIGILVVISNKKVLAVQANMERVYADAKSIHSEVFENWIRTAQAFSGEAELFHLNVFKKKIKNKAKNDYDGFVTELLERIEREEAEE